jgi:DNA-binding NarL/FixJ family response regulator
MLRVGSSDAALIEQGYDALRVGDTATARQAFESIATTPPPATTLEGLGQAAYLDRDYASAVELLGAAYRAYRGEHAGGDAIRVARMLAYINAALLGDAAVSQGWLARATTLLGDTGPSLESGWVHLCRGLFEPDAEQKVREMREALAMARRFGDARLEFESLAYLGSTLVGLDRTDEGMGYLDEALAAVTGQEVDDFAVMETVFCQLFAACEHAHDVDRAEQWIRVGEDAAARRNLPAISAHCHTHYGGLLTLSGRWEEADAALSDAVGEWATLGHGWARPGALARLADLRVRQGRFEEAEQLLDGLDVFRESARPFATLQRTRGETERAADTIERVLHDLDPTGMAAAPLWAQLVEIHLEAGDLVSAAAAADRLDECAARLDNPYVVAAAAMARGQLCVASSTGDATACLREALSGFSRARTPMETAEARLALARALAAERPQVALAEAKAALDAFERLPASRHADAAAALLRSLGGRDRPGPRESGPLTKREAEVLDLLGHGLSNPEIAERLYISRKTVEHHVSRILAKLGLRSRAEAAAYATRRSS